MKIEHIATELLTPYARNAKKHSEEQIAAIAESIKQFGFNSPVLVDADDGIIAGHGRVLAAKALELEAVPCIRLSHLTETQKQAYILADNRLSEIGGGWDTEMLRAELRALDDIMPELVQAAGWSEQEALALLKDTTSLETILNPEHKQLDLDAANKLRDSATIRQIMLVYGVEEYGAVVDAMADYAEKNGLSNNTEVVSHLLEVNGYAINQRKV